MDLESPLGVPLAMAYEHKSVRRARCWRRVGAVLVLAVLGVAVWWAARHVLAMRRSARAAGGEAWHAAVVDGRLGRNERRALVETAGDGVQVAAHEEHLLCAPPSDAEMDAMAQVREWHTYGVDDLALDLCAAELFSRVSSTGAVHTEFRGGTEGVVLHAQAMRRSIRVGLGDAGVGLWTLFDHDAWLQEAVRRDPPTRIPRLAHLVSGYAAFDTPDVHTRFVRQWTAVLLRTARARGTGFACAHHVGRACRMCFWEPDAQLMLNPRVEVVRTQTVHTRDVRLTTHSQAYVVQPSREMPIEVRVAYTDPEGDARVLAVHVSASVTPRHLEDMVITDEVLSGMTCTMYHYFPNGGAAADRPRDEL